jgi:hypothetical protein
MRSIQVWTLQFEHVRSVMLSEADVPPVLGAGTISSPPQMMLTL